MSDYDNIGGSITDFHAKHLNGTTTGIYIFIYIIIYMSLKIIYIYIF